MEEFIFHIAIIIINTQEYHSLGIDREVDIYWYQGENRIEKTSTQSILPKIVPSKTSSSFPDVIYNRNDIAFLNKYLR